MVEVIEGIITITFEDGGNHIQELVGVGDQLGPIEQVQPAQRNRYPDQPMINLQGEVYAQREAGVRRPMP